MKKLIPILAAILFMAGTISIHAQASTYALGASTCSPGSGIYCYGIPLNLAGQPPANVWLDVNSNAQFLKFGEGLANLGTATINQDASYQPTYGTVTYGSHTDVQMTSLNLDYYGTDSSGNAYSGAMTLSFDYYYVSTCSGRGCGGVLGWHRRVTGGSTTFAIAHYATPNSPIAPTPTCILSPGQTKCPPDPQ